MTATRTDCSRCGAESLPGMPTGCGHDDPLTLFTYDAPPVAVITPTAPTETAEAFRARLAAHHAEAVAFFAGFEP
jgi:hypothetical protein